MDHAIDADLGHRGIGRAVGRPTGQVDDPAVVELRRHEELLPRVSAVEPTAPASRMHSNFTNAYKTMPVRITPA